METRQESQTINLLLSFVYALRSDDNDITADVLALSDVQRHVLIERGLIACTGTATCEACEELDEPAKTYTTWMITQRGRELTTKVLARAAADLAMRIALNDVT